MSIIFKDLKPRLFNELNKFSSLATEGKELRIDDYRELIESMEKVLKMIRIALGIEKKVESKYDKYERPDMEYDLPF